MDEIIWIRSRKEERLKPLALAERVAHIELLFRSKPKHKWGMLTIRRNELQTMTSGRIMTQPILIVEDEEDIADFLTQVLGEIMPYPVLPLSSAEEALEAARSVKPSLLLLDYRLPDSDGLELSDRLHSSKGLEAVPTVLMSASPPPLKEMQKRHITFLPKPFDIQDLLEKLETLLPSQET